MCMCGQEPQIVFAYNNVVATKNLGIDLVVSTKNCIQLSNL